MIDPEALRPFAVAFLLQVLWALVAVIAAIAAGKAVRGAAIAALERRRAHPNVVALVGNLGQLAVFVVAVLIVVGIFTGDSFGWVLTTLGAFTIVIGISLQDILKNFFAGMYVLIERPFRIGDVVRFADHEGTVTEISFRTMQLRTTDGREVVVPNALLMLTPLVNLSRYPSHAVRLKLSVPAEQATGVPERLRERLGRTPAVAEDPPPSVSLRSFEGGRAVFTATLWARDLERAAAEAIAAAREVDATWDVQVQ